MHLPVHRRARTLGDHLFRGLARAFVIGIALEALIITAAGMQDGAPSGSGAAAWARADQASASQVRLMRKYACSTVGYADSVAPQSAIIRSTAGDLRVVSFARGWDVYTGDSPATLVAVCLGPLR